MTDVAVAGKLASASPRRAVFLSALFVCTIMTTVAYPVIGSVFEPAAYQQHAIILMLGWFATAHVGVTGFYYADREFRPHILANRTRYIYAPAIILATSIIAWGMTTGTPYFWIFWQIYHAWLLWHYMRQNVGVTALAAQASQSSRLERADRLAITLVGIGGIVAAARFGPVGPFAQKTLLFNLGLAIYLAGFGLGLFQAAKRILGGRREWITAAFILASVLFFAPTFFGSSYFTAIVGYATAHALQYWLLMTLVAVGGGQKYGVARSVMSLLVMVGVIWAFIWISRQGSMWGTWAAWVAGVGIGLTFAHFIVDADSWRLREAFQRNYVNGRLGKYLRS